MDLVTIAEIVVGVGTIVLLGLLFWPRGKDDTYSDTTTNYNGRR